MQAMIGQRTGRRARLALGGVLGAFFVALPAADATAGVFTIDSCQADRLGFSTRAFRDFATRGMMIRRACNPDGWGLRGLITGNVVGRGRVPRGSVALLTLTAPPGTRMTSFRWAGSMRRRDCRFAIQLWADAPDIRPVPIKNVRANRYCPSPPLRGRTRQLRAVSPPAQLLHVPSRVYRVTGATRIVQRVICVGDRKRKWCSARGRNYMRTYKASIGIVDNLPPAVAIMQNTPLARGAWVAGRQPLNYAASDNVGVRLARAFVAGRQRGSHDRPCTLGASVGSYLDPVPCPNGPGQIAVDTRAALEGTQSLVVQAQDAAGNTRISGAVTARIDNTPPARVDVGVEGGQDWRNQNDWSVAWIYRPEGDRAPIVAATYKLCASAGQPCTRGTYSGPNVSRLELTVPGPGEWTLSLWRRDAAGNEAESVAVRPPSRSAFLARGTRARRDSLMLRPVRVLRLTSRCVSDRSADLLIKCPNGTFPTSDVCVEASPRPSASYGTAIVECADAGRPAGPGRRLPTHGELRAALAAVPLAPGGELTSEVLPSSTTPGTLDVLYVTDDVGSVAVTPNTGAGGKAFRCVMDPSNLMRDRGGK
jgi:hypothetical protein